MTARRRSGHHLASELAAISLASILSIAASGTAHAQPAKPPSTNAQDTATAEARARFDEGIKHAEAGDHEAARLKFNQAWALVKSPAILYNLARAEHLSGHPVEAIEHYRQFSKLPPDPKVTDVQRQRAAESITELSKKVGQIAVEAPPTARISVDGRAIEPGNTDPIAVTPGKHVVEAITNGRVKSVTVDCPAGAVTTARLIEGETSQPPGAAPLGAASAGAEKAGRAEKPSDAGTGGGWSDGTAPPSEDKGPRFWTGGRITGLGVFGAGLAALGAGIVFHVGAESSKKAAEDIRSGLSGTSACNDPGNDAQCTALQKNVDDQTQRESLRAGFFIGGGALVVGGAVLFLVSSPKSTSSEPAQAGVRVLPYTTGRDTGLALLGRF